MKCELLLQKWDTLLEIQMVLQIPYKATIALQEKELCLSDTFGIWLKMQVHLDIVMKKCKSSFAKCLKNSILGRKKTIFENPVMSAAVYLDPRYRKEITRKEENRSQAIEFLANLYNRIESIKAAPIINIENAQSSTPFEESNTSIDFNDPKQLQIYLNRGSTNSTPENSFEAPVQRNTGFDINTIIELFQPKQVELEDKRTILQIWDDLKSENKHLFELGPISPKFWKFEKITKIKFHQKI